MRRAQEMILLQSRNEQKESLDQEAQKEDAHFTCIKYLRMTLVSAITVNQQQL